MRKIPLLSQIPFIIFAIILLYIPYSYLSLNNSSNNEIKENWHYYINPKHIETEGSNLKLQFQHEGQGYYQPIQLQIRTHANQKKYVIVDSLNHTHIDEIINYQKKDIKHLILKSQHPIMFTSSPTPRMLVTSQTQTSFVKTMISFFQIIIPIVHNLIIIGIITNSLDLFFPIIMTTQSLCMFAFLNSQKHFLYDFYKNIFNTKIDIFNLIRLVMFSNDSSNSSNANPLISTYGFTNNILYNLSGQMIIAVLFLAFTIFLKAGNVFLKNQRLRQVSSKLRPRWNGFIFLIMPKVLVFSGFSIRQFGSNFQGVFYPLVSIGILFGYLVFFIQLLLQVRRINQRVEYIDQSRHEIGLAQRIEHKQYFHFDCLNFSNLYYPTMNYMRFLFFFIPISMIYDFTYASFGGPIVSQLFYVMFNISSSGYFRNRDKIIYPFCDFLLIIIELAFISVGLAQSVLHSQISIIAETVFFALLLVVFMLLLLSVCLDIAGSLAQKQKVNQNKQQQQKKSTKFLRKTATTHCGSVKNKISKPIQQVNSKDNNSIISQGENNEQVDQAQSANSFSKPILAAQAKVRKIRRGKVV